MDILKRMLTKSQRKRILPCIGLVKKKVKDGVDILQSARAWYDTFSKALSTLEFMINERDPCVFNMADENGKIIASVFIHVDDGYLSCVSDEIVTRFKSQLEKIFIYGITWKEGHFHEYLGMVMDFSTPGKCYLTMKDYIERIVDEWKVEKTKEYPHTRELFTIDETKEKLNKEDAKKFHRCVAQLLYLSTHVRPDILVSTIFLTSRVKEPTVEDRKKLIQCLAYFKGTSSLGLCLRADKNGKLMLNCYSDASFNVHPDAKSHAGIVIFLGAAATLFKSYKIKMVNKSVADFELRHCDTENMCADILTKPLQGQQFYKLRAILLGYSDTN